VRVSPDGKTVAYTYQQAVWVHRLGGTPRRIDGLDGLPVWSPDGKQLVVSFRSLTPGRGVTPAQTWRVNADGSGRVKLEIPGTDMVADWSSDGSWLLAVSDRKRPGGGGPYLWIMHPDGSEPACLTDGPGYDLYPRFAADGRTIVYFHQEGVSSGLWTMAGDGKGRRKIIEEAMCDMQPCWSPDGASLAVCLLKQEAYSIEVMAADGSNRRPLSLPKAYWLSGPDWR